MVNHNPPVSVSFDHNIQITDTQTGGTKATTTLSLPNGKKVNVILTYAGQVDEKRITQDLNARVNNLAGYALAYKIGDTTKSLTISGSTIKRVYTDVNKGSKDITIGAVTTAKLQKYYKKLEEDSPEKKLFEQLFSESKESEEPIRDTDHSNRQINAPQNIKKAIAGSQAVLEAQGRIDSIQAAKDENVKTQKTYLATLDAPTKLYQLMFDCKNSSEASILHQNQPPFLDSLQYEKSLISLTAGTITREDPEGEVRFNEFCTLLQDGITVGKDVVVGEFGHSGHAFTVAVNAQGEFRIINSMGYNNTGTDAAKFAAKLNAKGIKDKNGNPMRFRGELINCHLQEGGHHCRRFTALYVNQIAKEGNIDAYQRVNGAFVDGEASSVFQLKSIDKSRQIKVLNNNDKINSRECISNFMGDWVYRGMGYEGRNLKIAEFSFQDDVELLLLNKGKVPQALMKNKGTQYILDSNGQEKHILWEEVPEANDNSALNTFIPRNSHSNDIILIKKEGNRIMKATIKHDEKLMDRIKGRNLLIDRSEIIRGNTSEVH